MTGSPTPPTLSEDAEEASYEFLGARVTVRYEVAGYAEWLDEVTAPAFTRTAHDPRATRLVVTIGDEVGPVPAGDATERVLCFVFDGESVWNPAHRTGATVDVLDERFRSRYVLAPDAVTLVVDPRAPAQRGSLLRITRELLLGQVRARPDTLLLHASAIEHDGAVVAFAGDKGAGKTTTAARVAAVTGGRFVANDCCLVAGPRPWSAHGVPIMVSVRERTAAGLAPRFRDVPDIDRPSHLTLDEAAAALTRVGPAPPGQRLRLSAPQFAHALGTTVAAGGRLDTIAFLEPDRRPGAGFRVEPLTAADAAARLLDSVYGKHRERQDRTVFEHHLGTRRDPGTDGSVARALATEIRCVVVHAGPALLTDDDQVERLVADLGAA